MIKSPERLRRALAEPRRLARALSRHCYGMGQWVDIFGAKLAFTPSLEDKALLARMIADNARHALLFRDRARELGEEPATYRVPASGERIYRVLADMTEPVELLGYARGSLVHFAALLAVYRAVADEASGAVIAAVQKDVDEHLRLLAGRLQTVTAEGRRRADEAEALAQTLYTDREEEEVGWYES